MKSFINLFKQNYKEQAQEHQIINNNHQSYLNPLLIKKEANLLES
mgnify:CR=1 FL=1